MDQQPTHRNWTTYNLSQTKEKLLALRIISNAVDFLCLPYAYKGTGRPPAGMDDAVKFCVIKVFNCFSSRRTVCELQLALALRYIKRMPHFNSLTHYTRMEEITPHLERLYKILALPLAGIENNFAVDASGFGMPNKKKWIDVRLERLSIATTRNFISFPA